ncbi:MAG: fibronectin type III domain-containing protein, partial [Actinoplanes sp.]
MSRLGVVLLATALTTASMTAPSAAAPPAASAGPATPTALWASSLGTGISLAWAQPRTGARAVSFRVYEGDEVVARTSTPSAALDVAFGSTHTYTVTAVDHRGRESTRTAPATGRSWLNGYNAECMPDPGVPLTVSASTASAVAVSWTRHPLGGELELRVDGRSLGMTALTSARIGGLAPGTGHQVALYRYSRCPTSGGYRLVASVRATTLPGDAGRPESPSGLTVTGRTDATVDLAWTTPPGQVPARYAVYDGATLVAATTRTAATVDRLHHATWHRFTVAALDNAGNESAHSAPVTAATEACLSRPPRPSIPAATALSASSVRLSWLFDAAATSYTVLDGNDPVATTRYPEAVVTGLPPGSRHAYRIVATLPQNCGESPRSGRAVVSTPAGPAERPLAPTVLTATGNIPGVW